ncbi:AhpC/TSA family protein [Chitinophaga horti]|uniref:AhpC/TSA family protein n=1 Tax=Chitinophaga horti TaxID=2920382 RepID=A0ABY6J2F6_9BACT|nr:TlpA disulfide reductase family protein [Chitinophaga horti]UYQ93848.1 AhpC/TSA family protein [Chitinophaga horti]
MKRIVLFAALFLPWALKAQPKTKQIHYDIKGVSSIGQPGKMYISLRKADKNMLDSAEVVDGQFTFKGKLEEPVYASIFIYIETPERPGAKSRKEVAKFFVDKGTTTVNIKDISGNAEIKGGAAQNALEQLSEMESSVAKQAEELQKQYRAFYNAKDEEGMKKIEPRFAELDAKRSATQRAYLKQHPTTPIGIYVINTLAGYDINLPEIEPIFNNLSDEVKGSPSGQAFSKRMDIARRTQVGQESIDFSQNAPDGTPLALSSLRGKYVLIDFWASWCGPCRAENPNVVKAYNQYKDKNFTVLGISLDESKEKWLKAIEKDQLTWAQVSDLKGWQNEVAKLYGIRAIPQNYLVDPKGRIIGKNLRGEALEKKLEELMGE